MTTISDKYASLGGAGGVLGAATSGELSCPDAVGRFRHYQHGSIYWHPETGAHEVHGMIFQHWKSLGWERSWLGYPVSDEVNAAGGGRISVFQAGAISWRSNRGAWDHGQVTTKTRHARTLAQHQADVTELRAGCRPLSLCVHGDSDDPRYTTVWLQRPGPKWAIIAGVDQRAFDTWVQQQAAQGLTPTLLSVVGDGRHVFAAVAEAVPPGTVRVGLRRAGKVSTINDFSWWVDWARRNHQILTCVSTYGSLSDPRFAAVWRPNVDNVPWDVKPNLVTLALEQQRFVAHTKHGARPVCSARHPGGRYVSVYHDDAIGPWVSKGELSEAALATEQTARAQEGYIPVSLQAGGSGSATRYTAVFAKRDRPLPRRFVANGLVIPGLLNVDLAVESFMRRNNIPAGSVAVARNHRLVYARAFTWGPSTAELASPQSLFRMASCSKVLTSVLIHRLLIEESQRKFARATLATKVKTLLGLSPPPGMNQKDPRFDDITIGQLLTHTSGLRNDFASLDYGIVNAFRAEGARFPLINKQWIARYLMTLELESTPGTSDSYSNAGYALLSAVIEHLSGGSWFAALYTRVLKPLGLTRPRVAASLHDQRSAGELHQLAGIGCLATSVMSDDHPLVRQGYGDANLAVGVGVGGMAMAPADFVRILSALMPDAPTSILSPPISSSWTHARGWGKATTTSGFTSYFHTGGLDNTESYISMRTDGLAITAAFARNGESSSTPPAWHDLLDVVPLWPTHDLFRSVGIG